MHGCCSHFKHKVLEERSIHDRTAYIIHKKSPVFSEIRIRDNEFTKEIKTGH